MSDSPFIGEITILPYCFAPMNYVFCEGQLMPIDQNPALFAVIGKYYGGDGINTMGIPKLTGRAPIGMGTGPGLTSRQIGGSYGTTQETLTGNKIPSHTHDWNILEGAPNTTDGNMPNSSRVTANFGQIKKGKLKGLNAYVEAPATYLPLSEYTVSTSGESAAHANMQPFLGLHFFMAVDGEYPARQ